MFTSLLALLTLLLFGGETLLGGFLDLQKPVNLSLYRRTLWHFFCTLWVLFEGIIMVYVIRIHGVLDSALRKDGEKGEKNPSKAGSASYGMAALILGLVGFYLLYDYHLIALVKKHHLDRSGFYNLFVFYVRVCGLFWISFEWIVAVFGIRTYHILRNWSTINDVSGESLSENR
jgi:hypothetical protein